MSARRQVLLRPSRTGPLRLTRLTDHEDRALRAYATPIEPDRAHEFELALRKQPPLLLPKVFVASEALFGPSSSVYDTDKGSFYFPLFLTAAGEGSTLRYLLPIYDNRGWVELPFYRIGMRVAHRWRSHRPVAGEFSRGDLNYLGEYILGHLLAFAEHVAAAAAPAFRRVVPSQSLVYGKRRGELFERRFPDEPSFERHARTIALRLRRQERRANHAYVTGLLRSIERTADPPPPTSS